MGLLDFLGGGLVGGTQEWNRQMALREDKRRFDAEQAQKVREIDERIAAGQDERARNAYQKTPGWQGAMGEKPSLENGGLRLRNAGQELDNQFARDTMGDRKEGLRLGNKKTKADIANDRARVGIAQSQLGLAREGFTQDRYQYNDSQETRALIELSQQVETDAFGNKTPTPEALEARVRLAKRSGLMMKAGAGKGGSAAIAGPGAAKPGLRPNSARAMVDSARTAAIKATEGR